MQTRFWPIVLCFVILCLATMDTPAMAKPQTLTGTVAYRERIALPPSAVIEVKLLDVSRADAAAEVIAQTTIRPRGQVPIPYRLAFNDVRIKPGHTYVLRASIRVGKQLVFTSATHQPVLTGGPDQTDILVQRVADRPAEASGGDPAQPQGRWLAEDIRQGGVIDRLQTVLEIAPDGTISGTGGCNRMAGKATITGDTIAFGPLASTNMACTPAAMDQEAKFFAALRDVRTWRVDPQRRKLALLGADGKVLVVFSRM